ncbi:MAG: SAM-dependent methyltransferase [Oceanospirillaceae bacterium]|jgi:SAM-dependent methyltransferase
MLNFSESCARNQQVIYDQLLPWLEQSQNALEIGSGSGQHALHFCSQLPQLQWQCADRDMWLDALAINIQNAELTNIKTPIELDVNGSWPNAQYDLVYTANSLHIMNWQSVQNLFANLTDCLHSGGYLCCYGPFKYAGEFTSPSNANFELWLKNRDHESGIRDFEAIEILANAQQLRLVTDINMPANNQLLIWKKA